MRVYAYTRYSTEHREDSIEVQRDIIKAYCVREWHVLANEYVDKSEC